jgi:hypothetical protein
VASRDRPYVFSWVVRTFCRSSSRVSLVSDINARQTLPAAIIVLPLGRIARHFRRWITCWIRRWLGQWLQRFKGRIARRIIHRLAGRIAFGGSDWIVERCRWTSRGRGHRHLVSFLEIALPALKRAGSHEPTRSVRHSANSGVFVYCVSGFVRCVLRSRLRVTGSLLGIAFKFLSSPFRLEFVRSDHVSNALLCLARRFVREAARLIRGATHDGCSYVAKPAMVNVANMRSFRARGMTRRLGFARMVERAAAVAATLELKAHPLMLPNKGHDTRAIQGWLGHQSIMSTAVYTALAPNRFKDFLAGLIVHSIAGRFQMLFATAAPEHERPPIEDSIDAPQICVVKAHERRLGFCPAKRRAWRRRQIVRALFL